MSLSGVSTSKGTAVSFANVAANTSAAAIAARRHAGWCRDKKTNAPASEKLHASTSERPAPHATDSL